MMTITTHSEKPARSGKCRRRLLMPVLMLLLAFAAVPQAYAQKKGDHKKNRQEMMQEVREFKIKYLIQECDIDKSRQDEFIKIYYDLEEERLNLAKEIIEARKAVKSKQNPTDEEYLRVADLITDFHAKEGAIDKNYYNQLKKILSPKQLYQLKIAEHKFNKKLGDMGKNKSKNKR